MSSNEVQNQLDVVKNLQSVEEDVISDKANFGVTPTSANFEQFGYNPRFTYTDQPEGVEVRILGKEGRDQKPLVGRTGLLDIRTNIISEKELKWFFAAAGGGVGTIDNSRTFVFSYLQRGTETFRVMKGCMPLNATITIGNRGLVELTGQIISLLPNNETQNANGDLPGTPVFAPALVGTPFTHLSGGSEPFTYNATKYRERNFTCAITRELSLNDSSGDVEAVFAKAARKTINGSISIFKKDLLLVTDSRSLTERSASRVVSSSGPGISLDFTNFQFQNHPLGFDQDSSDALIEELPYESAEVTVTVT